MRERPHLKIVEADEFQEIPEFVRRPEERSTRTKWRKFDAFILVVLLLWSVVTSISLLVLAWKYLRSFI